MCLLRASRWLVLSGILLIQSTQAAVLARDASVTTATVNTAAIQSSASAYASSLIAASSLQPYRQPTGIAQAFIAIGDSYTSGIGSNGKEDKQTSSLRCARYEQAYPELLQNLDDWSSFNGGIKPHLNFGACAGATLAAMNQRQLNPGNGNQNMEYTDFGQPALAVMTISGNDAEFTEVLNSCVYRIWLPKICSQILQKTQNKIASDKFASSVIRSLGLVAITGQKAAGAAPPESFAIYISEYISFFNSNDSGCDNADFSMYSITGAPLTLSLRRQMNGLVQELNAVIQAAAIGLAGIGVRYVDGISPTYNGHRFCEPGNLSYQNNPIGSQTWFWSWKSPWDSTYGDGPSKVKIRSSNENMGSLLLQTIIPDNASQVDAQHPPWTFSDAFTSHDKLFAALEAAQPQNDAADGGWISKLVPDRVRRVFHPKGVAYTQHASAFMSAIKADRTTTSTNTAAAPTTTTSTNTAAAATTTTSPSAPTTVVCPTPEGLDEVHCGQCPNGSDEDTCETPPPSTPTILGSGRYCNCNAPCEKTYCRSEGPS